MNKVVTFGEIMLRLSPLEHLKISQTHSFDATFGGAEANVSVSLAQFGIPAQFITILPKNNVGQAALSFLQKWNVDTSEILRSKDRLGIYFLEKGAINRNSNVIYDRQNSGISNVTGNNINWERIFGDANWFHWSGITPAISQQAADVCLEAVNAAKKIGLTISTDLNYRSKLWNYGKDPSEIMPELVSQCDIIHGGILEAKKYFSITPTDATGYSLEAHKSVLQQLFEHFPNSSTITTTLRETINASHHHLRGILYDGTEFIQSHNYKLTPIVDRVGGGDAFMAGIIYSAITHPNKNDYALHFATAAAALKHTIHGDANISTVDEVEKLMEGDASGRVSR